MTSTKIAFEFHFFEHGFKTLSVPKPRPDFVPEASRVGLSSNEVELGKDDFAIEASFFKTNGLHVAWLGSYQHAPDKTHGDRGNYAGLGVWIVDALPIQVSVFLKLLTKLSEQVARSGGKPDAANIQILEAALASKKADGATVGIDRIPDQIRERLFSNRPNNTSEYCSLNCTNDRLIDVVSADLLRRMIGSPDGPETNRFLYFQTSKSKVKLATNRIVTLDETHINASHEDALDSLLMQLSKDISEQNHLKEQMRQESGAAQSELKKLTQQVEVLSSQLNEKSKLEASFKALASSVNQFKADLEAVNGKSHERSSAKPPANDYKYEEIIKHLRTITNHISSKGQVDTLEPIKAKKKAPKTNPSDFNPSLSLGEILALGAIVILAVAITLFALRHFNII